MLVFAALDILLLFIYRKLVRQSSWVLL